MKNLPRKLLLYGDERYDSKTKKSIILASIKLIYSSSDEGNKISACVV